MQCRGEDEGGKDAGQGPPAAPAKPVQQQHAPQSREGGRQAYGAGVDGRTRRAGGQGHQPVVKRRFLHLEAAVKLARHGPEAVVQQRLRIHRGPRLVAAPQVPVGQAPEEKQPT